MVEQQKTQRQHRDGQIEMEVSQELLQSKTASGARMSDEIVS